MECFDKSNSLSLTGSLYLILLCLLMLAMPIVVSGQTASSVSREQMEKLDFMVGEWKGKGWMYSPNGSRVVELSQKTKVKKGKDGSTLTILDIDYKG